MKLIIKFKTSWGTRYMTFILPKDVDSQLLDLLKIKVADLCRDLDD